MPTERVTLDVRARDRASGTLDTLDDRLDQLGQKTDLEMSVGGVDDAIGGISRIDSRAEQLQQQLRSLDTELDIGRAEDSIDDLRRNLERSMEAEVRLDTSNARREIDQLESRLRSALSQAANINFGGIGSAVRNIETIRDAFSFQPQGPAFPQPVGAPPPPALGLPGRPASPAGGSELALGAGGFLSTPAAPPPLSSALRLQPLNDPRFQTPQELLDPEGDLPEEELSFLEDLLLNNPLAGAGEIPGGVGPLENAQLVQAGPAAVAAAVAQGLAAAASIAPSAVRGIRGFAARRGVTAPGRRLGPDPPSTTFQRILDRLGLRERRAPAGPPLTGYQRVLERLRLLNRAPDVPPIVPGPLRGARAAGRALRNPVVGGTIGTLGTIGGLSVLLDDDEDQSSLGPSDVETQQRNFDQIVQDTGVQPGIAQNIVDEIDQQLNAGRAVALRFASIALRTQNAEFITNAPQIFQFLRSRLRITGIEEAGPDAILDRLTQAVFEEGGLVNLSNLGIPESVVAPEVVEAQALERLGLQPGAQLPRTQEGFQSLFDVQAQALSRLATSRFGEQSIFAAEPGLRESTDQLLDANRQFRESVAAQLEDLFRREGEQAPGPGGLLDPAQIVGPEGAQALGTQALQERVETELQRTLDAQEQFPLFEQAFPSQSARFGQLRERFGETFQNLSNQQIQDLFQRSPDLRIAAFQPFERELTDQQRDREDAARQAQRAARQRRRERERQQREQERERLLEQIPFLPSGFAATLPGQESEDFQRDFLGLAPVPAQPSGFAATLSPLPSEQFQTLLSSIPGGQRQTGFGGGLLAGFRGGLGLGEGQGIGSLLSGGALGAVGGNFLAGLAVQQLSNIAFNIEDGVVGWLRRIFEQGEEEEIQPIGLDIVPGLGASSPAVQGTQATAPGAQSVQPTPGGVRIEFPGGQSVHVPTSGDGIRVPGLSFSPDEYSAFTSGGRQQEPEPEPEPSGGGGTSGGQGTRIPVHPGGQGVFVPTSQNQQPTVQIVINDLNVNTLTDEGMVDGIADELAPAIQRVLQRNAANREFTLPGSIVEGGL